MQKELNELESRIDAAVAFCQRLRVENLALKNQMVAVQTENQKLVDKLSTVLDRLEAMLTAFPKPAAEGNGAEGEGGS